MTTYVILQVNGSRRFNVDREGLEGHLARLKEWGFQVAVIEPMTSDKTSNTANVTDSVDNGAAPDVESPTKTAERAAQPIPRKRGRPRKVKFDADGMPHNNC